jgi:hypothetical protein
VVCLVVEDEEVLLLAEIAAKNTRNERVLALDPALGTNPRRPQVSRAIELLVQDRGAY